MQYRYTIAQLLTVFARTGRDERSIRNLLASRGVAPVGTDAAGLKTWDIRDVVCAIEERGSKAELDAEKLVGVRLDNERKLLDLDRRIAELKAEQREADTAEVLAMLGTLRTALSKLRASEVNAALDEVAQWAQSRTG